MCAGAFSCWKYSLVPYSYQIQFHAIFLYNFKTKHAVWEIKVNPDMSNKIYKTCVRRFLSSDEILTRNIHCSVLCLTMVQHRHEDNSQLTGHKNKCVVISGSRLCLCQWVTACWLPIGQVSLHVFLCVFFIWSHILLLFSGSYFRPIFQEFFFSFFSVVQNLLSAKFAGIIYFFIPLIF